MNGTFCCVQRVYFQWEQDEDRSQNLSQENSPPLRPQSSISGALPDKTRRTFSSPRHLPSPLAAATSFPGLPCSVVLTSTSSWWQHHFLGSSDQNTNPKNGVYSFRKIQKTVVDFHCILSHYSEIRNAHPCYAILVPEHQGLILSLLRINPLEVSFLELKQLCVGQ